MFYTVEAIKETVQTEEGPQEFERTFPISFKKYGYMFCFNYKHLTYFEEDTLSSEQGLIIKEHNPTSDDLAKLAKEYDDWCTKFKQTPNETLHKLLTDVEAWRSIRNTELELKAAAFEANLNKDMFFTSSLGFKSNGDRRTGTNLTNLVAMFDAMGGDTVDYRDYENQTHKLNKAQLQTLFAEQVINGNAIYEQKWAKQQAIAAAKNKSELDKVDLNFVMQDFSKKEKETTKKLSELMF